jgi:hypothetical protein
MPSDRETRRAASTRPLRAALATRPARSTRAASDPRLRREPLAPVATGSRAEANDGPATGQRPGRSLGSRTARRPSHDRPAVDIPPLRRTGSALSASGGSLAPRRSMVAQARVQTNSTAPARCPTTHQTSTDLRCRSGSRERGFMLGRHDLCHDPHRAHPDSHRRRPAPRPAPRRPDPRTAHTSPGRSPRSARAPRLSRRAGGSPTAPPNALARAGTLWSRRALSSERSCAA